VPLTPHRRCWSCTPNDHSAPQVALFTSVRLFCGVGSGLREELKSTTGIWREKMTMFLLCPAEAMTAAIFDPVCWRETGSSYVCRG
jgi:hypothetical protein